MMYTTRLPAASRLAGGRCGWRPARPRVNAGRCKPDVQRGSPTAFCTRTAFVYNGSRRPPTTCAVAATADLIVARTDFPQLDSTKPVLVWYKRDLRVDDHAGLALAASSDAPTAALYCLDPDLYCHLAYFPGGVEVLSWAVQSLAQDLEQRGVRLLVRVGSWQEVVPQVAAEVAAQAVVAEAEVEASYQAGVQEAAGGLEAAGVPLLQWGAPAHDLSTFKDNFRQWVSSRRRLPDTFPAPQDLRPAGSSNGTGLEILEPDALRQLLTQHALSKVVCSGTRAIAEQLLAEAKAGEAHDWAVQMLREGRRPADILDQYLALSIMAAPAAAATTNPAGPPTLLDRIAALEVPAAEGQSFPGIFWQLASLGAASPRQILNQSQSASSWWPAAVPLPRRAATAAVERADFHWQLAFQEPRTGSVPGAEPKWWRWRGHLTDYFEALPPGAQADPTKPAILLVHGFGAFCDQWRGNLGPLAEAGYRVYAPTLPGFGRSEKACLAYTQDIWGGFLRDFIVQVVGGPVVVAGNSIGGFISASMAADYPQLVSGLVLVNTAGPITPGATAESVQAKVSAAKQPPPKWVTKGVSQALLFYLERTIAPTLKWLYPSNPDRADDWLAQEIYRAACDSGSLDVFKAVFYLPPPRPLNYLVGELYRGPALVLQGAADPLNDARGRALQLRELCENIDVQLLEGVGHCPHDEAPELVNEGLLSFVRGLEGSRNGKREAAQPEAEREAAQLGAGREAAAAAAEVGSGV